jgi:hypothetical protein
MSQVSGGRENGTAGRRSPSLDDVQFLDRAAQLVARGWCQRGLARDRDGRQVEPWHESAASWSPLGALTRVWYENRGGAPDTFEVAYVAMAFATGGRLEEWNAARWRTKRHVLNAFARARGYLPDARRQVRARRSARSPAPEGPADAPASP